MTEHNVSLTKAPQQRASCTIRPALNQEESQIWWSLLQDLGWNRSPYDLERYLSITHSKGLLLAISDSSETPQGFVMATINDNSTGWVTTFVVKPEHQGLGYGRALLDAAMEEFKANNTTFVGLDSVVQQKQTYERRGFVESPLGTIRIMCRGLLTSKISVIVEPGYRVVAINDIPGHLLAQSDLNFTGFERKGLWLSYFLERDDVFGHALVKEGPVATCGDIVAWAVIRRCSSGFRLGPVYAADASSAQAVVAATMNHATVELIHHVPIRGDLGNNPNGTPSLVAEVWGGNVKAVSVFEELEWEFVGVEYNRMWLNDRPTKEQDKGGLAQTGIFAVFDAAVG